MSNFGRLAPLAIEDEGISIGTSNVLDFAGAGVSAAIVGGKAVVAIPGGGVAGGELLSIFDGIHSTASTEFVTVARAVINFSKYSTPLTFRWNQVSIPEGNAEVQLWNVTLGASLGSLIVTGTGIWFFSVTNPNGVNLVYLRHRRVSGGGTSRIEGGVLESA